MNKDDNDDNIMVIVIMMLKMAIMTKDDYNVNNDTANNKEGKKCFI